MLYVHMSFHDYCKITNLYFFPPVPALAWLALYEVKSQYKSKPSG